MPRISGLIPTVRITSVESEAPMKNIVSVRHLRATPEITVPNDGTLSRTKVFRRIAMTKYRINHGILILRSLFLKINDVTSASATDMFPGFALITGPTAAIALPPQIAVPELIRYDVSLSTIRSFLPISIPIASVPITEIMVKEHSFTT